jgi:hypothetical protein
MVGGVRFKKRQEPSTFVDSRSRKKRLERDVSRPPRSVKIFDISIADLEKNWLVNMQNIKIEPVPKTKIEETKITYSNGESIKLPEEVHHIIMLSYL